MPDGMTKIALGAALAAGASLAGAALVAWQPKRTRSAALAIAAFAAGVILGAAFLHLLPEAFELTGPGATAWLLGAFFSLYLLETHVVRHEHHDAHGPADHALVPAEAHAAHLHVQPPGEHTAKISVSFQLASIAAIAFAL